MDYGSNVSAGGLTFSPLVSSGGVIDASSGLHFDVPLAAIQASANNALNFTASTNSQNQGFLGRVLNLNANLLNQATQQSTGVNHAAISAGYGVGIGNINLAGQISTDTLNASKYAIQQQSYQVQKQNQGSIWKSLIHGIFH